MNKLPNSVTKKCELKQGLLRVIGKYWLPCNQILKLTQHPTTGINYTSITLHHSQLVNCHLHSRSKILPCFLATSCMHKVYPSINQS